MSRSGAGPDPTRAELWIWPGIAAALALALGLVLTELQPETGTVWSVLAWPGDVEAASTVLQTIAGAAVSTLTLSLSLTVVAIQLFSQQFSPRLLRDLLRDRVTKAVLAVLVASFVFALTVQRRLDREDDVPTVAMVVAVVLGIASLGALLTYINHMSGRLRIDTMMVVVHGEAERAIASLHPRRDDVAVAASPDAVPGDAGAGAGQGHLVTAGESGFVRDVDVEGVLRVARDAGVVVRVDVRPGDHVVVGTPVGRVWGPADVVPAVAGAVRGAVRTSYERAVENDPAYAFRQLADIAVKALSPGTNDPVTAAHAIGHTGVLLVELLDRRLGAQVHEDEEGTPRVVTVGRDLRYYLDLSCGQVRRYGGTEPTVVVALLRMLRDVAVHVRDAEQAREVQRQIALVLEAVDPALGEVERDAVADMERRVGLALAGDVAAAYEDRSGETRSL